MWSPGDIADAISAGLQRRAAALDLEQAVRGLDVLDELGLHPMLTQLLHEAGYGVHREQRYPAERRRRRTSEGERCDLVLTPSFRPLAAPGAEPTLFDPVDAVPLDEALWLEVKVVAQFTLEGPNHHYASQLLSSVRGDVAKLSKDPGILHAGLLIVLWVQDPRVAHHDLAVWYDRCIALGLPISLPSLRVFSVTDRIGNGAGAVAVYPVSHL